MKDSDLFRIKIGNGAYKNDDGTLTNDYAGRSGTVHYCDECCKGLRVQFDEIGNNESFSRFDLSSYILTQLKIPPNVSEGEVP